MGLYDYVRCDVPLPDGWSGSLQTKEFDCCMTTHVITSEGRLMLDSGYFEEVPREERPYREGSDGIIGVIRWIPKLEVSDFHGYVGLVGTELERVNGALVFHEYRAKFTDGQLVGIEVVDGRSN